MIVDFPQHVRKADASTLRLAGGGLELEVRVPAEALPLLTEVFGRARLFWHPRRVTHYDISARAELAQAVIPFLDAAVCQPVS